MTVYWAILWVALGIAVLAAVFAGLTWKHEDVSGVGAAVALAAGICFGVLLIAGGLRWISITARSRDCEQYSQNTGREVEFVTFSFGGYECYVTTDNGIFPKDQLRDVDP